MSLPAYTPETWETASIFGTTGSVMGVSAGKNFDLIAFGLDQIPGNPWYIVAGTINAEYWTIHDGNVLGPNISGYLPPMFSGVSFRIDGNTLGIRGKDGAELGFLLLARRRVKRACDCNP